MELWRKNLYSVWAAQFIAAVGLNMVVPFLPLYLRDLGVVEDEPLKLWSGVVFAAAFLVSAFMQPLWGILGDRVGRKPMIVRAMIGLGLAHVVMGFAQNVFHLLLGRLFQGCLAGFLAPSLALVASSTPPDKTGFALGTLQTALISSLILGPFVGGVLVHFIGARPLFFLTGALCLCGALVVLRFVKETFKPVKEKKKSELRRNFRSVFCSPVLRSLFFLQLLVQFSIFFVAPFLTLYVEFLGVPQDYVGLVSGAIFGVTGITSALTSAFWGRRADRVGYGRVLRVALFGMIAFLAPQAFVTDAWQLMVCRAGLGLFVSGTVPIINSIVRLSTDESERGGIYGIFQSGFLLGNMLGPLLGGVLAAYLGLRAVFLSATGFLFIGPLLERNVKSRDNPAGPGEAARPRTGSAVSA
jgi:DHA1 family multidrug resistance protein-like MFS transporter